MNILSKRQFINIFSYCLFMKFDITFLGTGQAIPTSSRNHVGILVSGFGENMLFDCGEGIQRQFRKAHISPTKITRIFISHWHGDHVLGLPGLLQTISMSFEDKSKKISIYGPHGIKRKIEDIIRLFPFYNKLDLGVHEISEGAVLENKNFLVNAALMHHTIPCLAYSIIEKDQLRIDKARLKKLKIPNSPLLAKLKQGKDIIINGKKIKADSLTHLEKGKKITIILDTKPNQNAVRLAKNSDILICESTYGDAEEDIALEYSHMTSRQAAQLAKDSKSEKLFLTHFSQRYEGNEKELLRQASEVFKDAQLTKDLDKLSI